MGDKSVDLAAIVDGLIKDVGEDRDRLTSFLDALVSEYADSSAGIAEHVAKLLDAATRQHQVKVALVKSLSRVPSEDDGDAEVDEISREIGMPFSEAEDGSN